jgi:tetratricopeptide (TPR) repeat protein
MPGLDDSTLTIPASGANGYPPWTANPFAIRRLVRRGDFSRLDSLLSAAADSAHRDVRNESYLISAYDAMAGDTSLAAPLERWSREQPTSAPAHLARAVYLGGQAWVARGTAYAPKTSQQSMQRMNDLFKEATSSIDSALAITPQSAVAYLLLLSMAKAAGDSGQSHRYLTKGLEDIPASFVLRRQYLRNLVPRWGGSYDAMRAYADESQAMAETNPRLRALSGFISLDSAEVLELQQEEGKALAAYTRALGYGDELQFHLERGQMLLRAGRARDALPDLDVAVAAWPGSPDAYLWRGMARESLWSRYDRTKRELGLSALADYQRAVVLYPTDVALDRFARLYRILH